ncbi:MAG: glycosyltransferase family 39 protein [Bacteroidetes bacterium]|nr:glycosyltransferase family 39 protein [Bacteroidota bacterium]
MPLFFSRDRSLAIWFYPVWFGALLLQATYTQLFADEAYYWMYSKHLAWGYFDHPPALALLIKAGTSLFGGELGVRFFLVLTSLATMIVWESVIQPKDKILFYALLISIGVLHLFGFLASPDAPLLLSSSLFFYFYNRFLQRQDWWLSLAMGAAMAAMLLSKYQAVLLVGLVILSNLRLLRSPLFWFSCGVSAVLCIPHLIWQINLDWPSFRYHLFERSTSYHLQDTIDYLASQPFFLGPFTGIFALVAVYKVSAAGPFEKALKFVFCGVLVFFLLMTFRGRVEAHWTLIGIFPAVYFTYRHLSEFAAGRKIFFRLLPVAVVLILVTRIVLIFNYSPSKLYPGLLEDEFFDKREWSRRIHEKAGSLPVAFVNSYQWASLYEFYGGSPSFSLNNEYYRKNQYDLWDTEKSYNGKKVVVVPNTSIVYSDSVPGVPLVSDYLIMNPFLSFSDIKVRMLTKVEKLSSHDSTSVKCTIERPQKVRDPAGTRLPAYLGVRFSSEGNGSSEYLLTQLAEGKLNNEIEVKLIAPGLSGKYDMHFIIMTDRLPPTINSRRYKVTVSK